MRSDPTDALGLADTTQARLEEHSQPKNDQKVTSPRGNRDLGSGWVSARPSVADSSTQPVGLPALKLGWHVCNLRSGATQPRTLVSIP